MQSLSGPDQLDVAIILISLGNTTITQGEPAQARAFFARALEIFRHNLGQDHPYTIVIEEHLHALPQAQLIQETVEDDYDFYF